MDNKKEIERLGDLIDTMDKATKARTLEEQVAYLKSKGVDLAKSYRQWNDKDDKDDDK